MDLLSPHRSATCPGNGRELRPPSLTASAMEAIGIVRSKIEFWGGWAIASSALSRHYIDPAMPPSADARWFFGHLAADYDGYNYAANTWQPLPDPAN